MTGSSKLLTIAPFFFFFFFLKLSLYSCFLPNDSVLCPEIEKQALLVLKQSLSDPSHHLLSSWIGETNCCSWRGVVCNSFSGGHVHELRLRGYHLTGKLNPSLLNLTYLMYLDLSNNNFLGEAIPSFFGSLTTLKYLNLSNSNFSGTIPHTIGKLSNLSTLCLEGQYGYGIDELFTDNVEWLSGLYQLEHLTMNHVNLSRATNWFQVINKLSSLKELYLRGCHIDFLAPIDVVNMSSLSTLDLSSNYFPTFVPKWIFQLSNLVYLDISFCEFEGPIPNIINSTKIQYLDFSGNHFNLTIPNWFDNMSKLEYMDLSHNYLTGSLPTSFGNMSKLEYMDLSQNSLNGSLPTSFGNMSKLEHMDLSQNELVGAIPTSLGTLSSLKYMSLSVNKLSGNIPESLGQLFNLESFSIYDNMLNGVVTENHMANLTNLKEFLASRNQLTLKVKRNWIPPFQLTELELASWKLSPDTEIPPWLETQKDMLNLDLSNTGISSTIPQWIFSNIVNLHLSYNNLYGKIPYTIGSSTWGSEISLRSNRLSGPLPRASYSLMNLDLSNNSFTGGLSDFVCGTGNATNYMFILFLDENQLSGKLPDCWMNWPDLFLLNLGNNKLSGSIPKSLGIASLLSLKLYGNEFSGQIPPSLLNSTVLFQMDLGNNNLDGNIPTWKGRGLPNLRILILQSNKLSGQIPLDLCHLQLLQILDLSNNNFFGPMPWCFDNFTAIVERDDSEGRPYISMGSFLDSVSITTKGRIMHYDTFATLVKHIDLSRNNLSGEIPKEFTHLVQLVSLNLSSNHLTGTIPEGIGNMKQLESLDLSRNSFLGEIPHSFTGMSCLSYLDLSYNNLTGKIPEGTQIRGMDPWSFEGNNLCGPPLPRNCSNDKSPLPKSTRNGDQENNKINVPWLYLFMSLGYAAGLSATFSVLILKKSWRVALFAFVEDTWDEIYVFFHVKWKMVHRRICRVPSSGRVA